MKSASGGFLEVPRSRGERTHPPKAAAEPISVAERASFIFLRVRDRGWLVADEWELDPL